MTKKNSSFLFIFIIFSSLAFGQSKLEKMIDKMYDKIEGDSAKPKKNSFFAVPIWGVSPETGFLIGLSLIYLHRQYNDTFTRPSLFRLNTQYTQLSQYSIRPYIDLFTKNNRYNIKASYTFKSYNEYYWGIGNETPNNNKALYDFSQNRLQLRVTKQVFKGIYLGIQSEQNLTNGFNFKEDSLFEKKEVIGKNGSFTSGVGLVVSFDNRNQIYYPTKGHFIDITTLFNQAFFGSDFNFNNLTIDARKYVKLWNKNVLALQGFVNLNDGNIPFKQLATIGSESYMRGYYNGRFRDNHAMAFQAELRKKVWGPISLTFFGGFGNVANQTSILFTNLKPNYGIGFRAIAIRRDHVNIRIDYGRGENGIQGFYFTMNEAF